MYHAFKNIIIHFSWRYFYLLITTTSSKEKKDYSPKLDLCPLVANGTSIDKTGNIYYLRFLLTALMCLPKTNEHLPDLIFLNQSYKGTIKTSPNCVHFNRFIYFPHRKYLKKFAEKSVTFLLCEKKLFWERKSKVLLD